MAVARSTGPGGPQDVVTVPTPRRGVPVARVSLPRVPPFTIERPRLEVALAPPGRPPADVALVCAPAGYGKTTFLSRWATGLRARGQAVAWVSCDGRDDATALWALVAAAMSVGWQRATPSPAAAAAAQAWSRLQPPPVDDDRTFVATVLELLDAGPGPVVLVLDDAHTVTHPSAVRGLDDLLRDRPSSLRVVLGARHDPTLDLHRLRLDGGMAELRTEHLVCTRAESAHLLAANGLRLAEASLDALHERTEGWPAGLRLAALYLEQEVDPDAACRSFAADHRLVADYLVGAVLAKLPAEQRSFLRRTSVLEEVCAELAEAVTGRPGAGAMLEGLEQRNALVFRLGRAGRWYRYHSLLREYLAADLLVHDPGDSGALHRAASRWYLEHDQPAPALRHAVDSRDDDLVLSTLDRVGLRMALSGATAPLLACLRASSPQVQGCTLARLLQTLVLLDRGRREPAEQALRQLEPPDRLPPGRTRDLRVALDLYAQRLHGEVRERDPQHLLSGVGAGLDPDLEALTLAQVGTLLVVLAEPALARSAFLRALELARAGPHPYLQLHCLNGLAGAEAASSEIVASRTWSQATLDLAEQRGWTASPRLAYAYVLSAWAGHLTLDDQTARRHATRGLALLEPGIDPEVEGVTRCGEAVIRFHAGPRREALADLRRWWARADAAGVVLSRALVAYASLAEVHMCLALDEVGLAREVVRRAESRGSPPGETEVLRSLLALAAGRPQEAARLVQPVVADELVPVTVMTRVTARLVCAVSAARQQRTAACDHAVLQALEVSEASGCLRPYADMQADVAPLLAALRGRAGRREEHLQDVLARLADEPAGGEALQLEAFTPRERDVLRELPSLLSLEDIADRQQVSVNTVKTHVRAVYRKLGVSSRRDAVAVARSAELL